MACHETADMQYALATVCSYACPCEDANRILHVLFCFLERAYPVAFFLTKKVSVVSTKIEAIEAFRSLARLALRARVALCLCVAMLGGESGSCLGFSNNGP